MPARGTPAGRIKLERFGNSSVVLARWPEAEVRPADQSAHEPLVASAYSIYQNYRGLVDAKRVAPEELARLIAFRAHR